ncbi:hypothetical protein EV586_104113 [Tumebacillus sp. BK434]|nr:hypothetical protein EV586_104113 [Tumebacillus sp. BK434]
MENNMFELDVQIEVAIGVAEKEHSGTSCIIHCQEPY